MRVDAVREQVPDGQHVLARGADKRITDAIDTHVHVEQANDDDDGAAGGLLPVG